MNSAQKQNQQQKTRESRGCQTLQKTNKYRMITQWSHLPFILNILFKICILEFYVCDIYKNSLNSNIRLYGDRLTLMFEKDEEDDNNNARHAKQVCKINHIITSDLFTWMTLMTENGLFLFVCFLDF